MDFCPSSDSATRTVDGSTWRTRIETSGAGNALVDGSALELRVLDVDPEAIVRLAQAMPLECGVAGDGDRDDDAVVRRRDGHAGNGRGAGGGLILLRRRLGLRRRRCGRDRLLRRRRRTPATRRGRRSCAAAAAIAPGASCTVTSVVGLRTVPEFAIVTERTPPEPIARVPGQRRADAVERIDHRRRALRDPRTQRRAAVDDERDVAHWPAARRASRAAAGAPRLARPDGARRRAPARLR